MLVHLHAANARRNVPDVPPQLAPVDHRVATARELWEDWEARECLEVEQADEAYMAELRRLYSERVEEECRQNDLYKAGATVIDLCSGDGDGSGFDGEADGEGGGSDGDSDEVDPGPMTESG